MRGYFKAENFTYAVIHAITEVSQLLAQYFPRCPDDRNELPNTVLES